MQLHPVSLKQLSALEHEVRLPSHLRFHTPEFKVIAYTGSYRSGSQGKEDALYIMATAAAAHEAWYTDSIVIDFSGLSYDWGDQMEWVLNVGRGAVANCDYPLAIIVGPDCEQALRSLMPDEYDNYCVSSLEDALTLLVEKRRAYEECLAAWRARPLSRTV